MQMFQHRSLGKDTAVSVFRQRNRIVTSVQAKAHQDQRIATTNAPTRRAAIALIATLTQAFSSHQWADAAPLPVAPSVGNCPDCLGEVEDTLNVCTLEAESCTSTQNDDEMHFVAPWQYEGDRSAAVSSLVRLATGGSFDGGEGTEPISRGDAAGYIFGGVAAVVQGKDLPDKPKRQAQSMGALFDGVLADRHTTSLGSEYVRVTFGLPKEGRNDVDDPTRVIDAEFLFPEGDNIVVIRAASRVEPSSSQGQLQLSFSKGVIFEKNVAATGMERLRKAMRWEAAPVITDFDPRFNNSKPLWFEKLYQPFLSGDMKARQGEDQSELPLVDGRRV